MLHQYRGGGGGVVSYPHQNVAVSSDLSWLLVIFLAKDTFSILPLPSERVDESHNAAKDLKNVVVYFFTLVCQEI